MRAQQVVRIPMPARHDQLDLGLDRHATGASSHRFQPWSGPLADPCQRPVLISRVRRLGAILRFSRPKPGRSASSGKSASRASTRHSDISLQAYSPIKSATHSALISDAAPQSNPLHSFRDILSAQAPARQTPTRGARRDAGSVHCLSPPSMTPACSQRTDSPHDIGGFADPLRYGSDSSARARGSGVCSP